MEHVLMEEVWFRSFSFLNGWCVGSMLICHPKNLDPSYGNTRPSVHDTPWALKQVVVTPHDIPRILRAGCIFCFDPWFFTTKVHHAFERPDFFRCIAWCHPTGWYFHQKPRKLSFQATGVLEKFPQQAQIMIRRSNTCSNTQHKKNMGFLPPGSTSKTSQRRRDSSAVCSLDPGHARTQEPKGPATQLVANSWVEKIVFLWEEKWLEIMANIFCDQTFNMGLLLNFTCLSKNHGKITENHGTSDRKSRKNGGF